MKTIFNDGIIDAGAKIACGGILVAKLGTNRRAVGEAVTSAGDVGTRFVDGDRRNE